MTCKGAMCTDKHLGVDTAQVKELCKSIIKMCDTDPHSVDSQMEAAYVELSAVAMMMKRSHDRSALEIAQYTHAQNGRKKELDKAGERAVKYPAYLTTPRIHKMLEGMTPQQLEEITERIKARRA